MESSTQRNSESCNFLITDGDIARLQAAISKLKGECVKGSLLLDEVQQKIGVLWQGSRDNVWNRMKIDKLEKENCYLRQRVKGLTTKLKSDMVSKTCHKCIGFKRDRDFFFKKYKLSEGKVSELHFKCVEQEELLNTVRQEISQIVAYRTERVLKPLEAGKTRCNFKIEKTVAEDLNIPKQVDEAKTVAKSVQDMGTAGPYCFWSTFTLVNPIELTANSGSEACVQVRDLPPVIVEKTDYEPPTGLRKPGRPKKGTVKPPAVLLKCPFPNCSKAYRFPNKMRDHIRRHTGEKPYACSFEGCDKRFTSSTNLGNHVKMHTSAEDFKCLYEGCGKKYSQPWKLKHHTLTHTQEKKHKCPVEGCGMWFVRKQSMKKHQEVHTGEKPFVCGFEGCGRRFARMSGLKEHGFVHEGTRRNPCTYEGCTASFSHKRKLEEHSLIHTGEKPFKCEFEGCGRSFAREKSLRGHSFIHTGDSPFECPHEGCGQRLTTKASLDLHILIHTGERPFVCKHPGCGKSFTQGSTLRNHMKMHRRKGEKV